MNTIALSQLVVQILILETKIPTLILSLVDLSQKMGHPMTSHPHMKTAVRALTWLAGFLMTCAGANYTCFTIYQNALRVQFDIKQEEGKEWSGSGVTNI